MQYNTLPMNYTIPMHSNAIQYNSMKYNTIPMQCNTTTIQYNIIIASCIGHKPKT
jgi:hypothetical protein